MSGWKTRTGVLIGVIGGALLATANIFPIPEYIPWVQFTGTFLTAIGGGLGIYGVGSKVDKQNKVIVNEQSK